MSDRRAGVDRRETPREGSVERRKRGRPRVADEFKSQSSTLHIRVGLALHDTICQISVRRGLTVNAVVRLLLERGVSFGD